MTWTLILTFAMGVDSGVAMQTVRFPSEATCMTAGALWLKQTADGEEPRRWHKRRSAICVPSL